MKLTIESTEKITEIDGIPVRYWKGVTEKGIECHVFVHRIAVRNENKNCDDFDKELKKMSAPMNTKRVELSQIL